MAPRRRYTTIERGAAVAAVAANSGSVHGTAKILGIPETSLRQWCNGRRHPELLPLSERYKKELADKLAHFADLAIGVALKKVNELSAYQAVICACIATDKWLLLTGQMPSRRRRGAAPVQDAGQSGQLACLRKAYGAKPTDPPPEPSEEDYEDARRLLAQRRGTASTGQGKTVEQGRPWTAV
jgi:hypothetical protein